MKMKNKKSVCSQLQKNIVIINLLLIICSGSYAEVPLPTKNCQNKAVIQNIWMLRLFSVLKIVLRNRLNSSKKKVKN